MIDQEEDMSELTEKLTRSYLHIPKKKPLIGKTLGQLFNERVEENPDTEMYVFYSDKERKTYRQMQIKSQQFAASLLKLGLKKGDILGVWGGNHYEWLLAYLAAFQIGIITVVLVDMESLSFNDIYLSRKPQYIKELDALTYPLFVQVHMRIDFPLHFQQEIIKKLGINVIVLMRSPSDLCDQASQIIPELLTNFAEDLKCKSTPSVQHVINAGTKTLKGAFTLTNFMEIGKTIDKSEVVKAMVRVDYDDPSCILFTSGSTGFPKGVTHTHKTMSVKADYLDMYSVDNDGSRIPWTNRYALIMSFGGVGAQCGAMLPVLEEATTIVVGPTYDAHLLAQVIQEERVTGASMQIHHLNDMLNLPDFDQYDFSSLQLCEAGGSTIPRSLRDRAATITKHLLLSYGGSEGFIAAQTPRFPSELLENAVYLPMDGQEVKVIGPDENILPINAPGELCFRNFFLFMKYWGDEEKTKAAKKPNGWYHTGDLGTLDKYGYLRIIGRKAEQIIKEGINIAPGNLEKVIDQHPAVNNVMVVGVPDERTLEEVCACIRLHPSSQVSADELTEFCKGKVSDFLVPKYIMFMEAAFPTTETGKFDRNKLAEQAKKHLGL